MATTDHSQATRPARGASVLTAYRELLINRSFALLWGGQTVSWFGNALDFVALLWLVQDMTGSRAMMGLVAACRSLPSLLGFAVGALVDRWDRRRVMIASDLVRAFVVALLPLLYWTGWLRPWQLPVLAVVLGVAAIFFVPARQSFMPTVVARNQLVQANGLMTLSCQLVNAAGYGIGGILIGFVGTMPLFIADAVSFLLSAASIALMGPSPAAAKELPGLSGFGSRQHGLAQDVRKGLAFILQTPTLIYTIPFILVLNFAIVPLFVLLPAWARDVLGGNAATYGFLQTAHMLGMVGGALLVTPVQGLTRRSTLIFTALTTQGLVLTLLVMSRTPAIAIGAIATFGLLDALITITWTAYIQAIIPRDMMGRVFGAMETATQILVPAGQALGGIAGQWVALPVIYGAAATLRLAGSLVPWFLPRLATLVLDREPTPEGRPATA